LLYSYLYASVCKGPFTRSKFSIKNLVKVFFDKVLWSSKPASKTLSKNFDGIKNHPIFLKALTDFDGNWPINGDLENLICVVERNKVWPGFWRKTLIV
jgi:hypothetical protein